MLVSLAGGGFGAVKTMNRSCGRLLYRASSTLIILSLLVSCATAPPKGQQNLCTIFDQYPQWYDYAATSEKRWGTPKQILMAFVKQESSFRQNAKPPFKWFLFVPLGRGSSAKGYAQAQDPVWSEYEAERGSLFRSRGDMEDAVDFIGWYNHNTNKRLGISKWNTRELYLAYHEGHGGYKRGSFKNKRNLLKVANSVKRTAEKYGRQLRGCEDRFKCSHWYQIRPLCR